MFSLLGSQVRKAMKTILRRETYYQADWARLKAQRFAYVGSNKFCTLRQALALGWSPVKTMNFHAPDECSILSSLQKQTPSSSSPPRRGKKTAKGVCSRRLYTKLVSYLFSFFQFNRNNTTACANYSRSLTIFPPPATPSEKRVYHSSLLLVH